MAEEFREEKTEDLLSTLTTPLDRPVREKNLVKTFDLSTIRDSPREFIITREVSGLFGVKKRKINSREN
ncbi:hypothetical protein SUGI_0969600 [Cryptomeria japonica]|nr:hypothetical protein SUGI_0969600 [Cryptomeria japonica]